MQEPTKDEPLNITPDEGPKVKLTRSQKRRIKNQKEKEQQTQKVQLRPWEYAMLAELKQVNALLFKLCANQDRDHMVIKEYFDYLKEKDKQALGLLNVAQDQMEKIQNGTFTLHPEGVLKPYLEQITKDKNEEQVQVFHSD